MPIAFIGILPAVWVQSQLSLHRSFTSWYGGEISIQIRSDFEKQIITMENAIDFVIVRLCPKLFINILGVFICWGRRCASWCSQIHTLNMDIPQRQLRRWSERKAIIFFAVAFRIHNEAVKHSGTALSSTEAAAHCLRHPFWGKRKHWLFPLQLNKVTLWLLSSIVLQHFAILLRRHNCSQVCILCK